MDTIEEVNKNGTSGPSLDHATGQSPGEESEISEAENSISGTDTVELQNKKNDGLSDDTHKTPSREHLVNLGTEVEENGSGVSGKSLHETLNSSSTDFTDISIPGQSDISKVPETENSVTTYQRTDIIYVRTKPVRNGDGPKRGRQSTKPTNDILKTMGVEKNAEVHVNPTSKIGINGNNDPRQSPTDDVISQEIGTEGSDESPYRRNYRHIAASVFSDLSLATRMQNLQRSLRKKRRKSKRNRVNPKR